MSKPPVLRSREICRALEKAGFSVVRQSGSHLQYRKANLLVTVPVHPGDLQLDTLRSILRQAKMTVDELRDLL